MIKKESILFSIKIIVSISLLTFLLWNVDWNTVTENFSSANVYFILFASVLNLIERFELTYKWNLLLKVRKVSIKFGRLFLINSIGTFLGLFLPSSVGTDVVRSYYLVKNNDEKSVSISSVFVDRVLGLFALLILGLVAVFFADDILAEYNIKLYVILLCFATAFSFFLFQKQWVVIYLKKMQNFTKYKKYLEYGIKLHSSILEYKKYPKTIWFSFFITLLVQVTRVLTYYFIALAFGIDVSLVYYFLFVPLIMIVIMLPISIGGLGLREGAFVAFFTLTGMSVEDAVIISFINSFLDMLNTLILGGGGYLFYKSPSKEITDLTNKPSF